MERKIEIVTLLVLCLSWQVHAQVNCTSAGRFADDTDTTCQNYVLCVYDTATATYLSYNYTCPTTSVFNPNTAMCTTNYVCNVTASNTTATNSSSVCTADGFVADPSSTNCSSYIECVDINGTFTETPYECPNNTFYNPNTTLCEPDYNCTTAVDTAFSCTAAGRFADTSDTNCQSYFFCVLQSDEVTYVQYNYTCPTVSVFNPTSKVCTTSYTCPTA